LQLEHFTSAQRSCTRTRRGRAHRRGYARARRHCDPLGAFRPSSFSAASSLSFPRAGNNVVVGRGDSSSVGDKRPIKGTIEPQHRRITTCSARSCEGGKRYGVARMKKCGLIPRRVLCR
jgi:hypothetical protein